MSAGIKIALIVLVAGGIGYFIYSQVSGAATSSTSPDLASGLTGGTSSTDNLLPTGGDISTDNTKATVRPVSNNTPALSRGDGSNRPHEI